MTKNRVIRRGHVTGLTERANEMRKCGHLTDVLIVCDGDREIEAHRIIISAASDYFNAMFTGSLRESRSNRIELPGICSDAMEDILDFLYTGNLGKKVYKDVRRLCLVYRVSHYLGVSTLSTICSQSLGLKLKADCFVEVWKVAEELDDQQLLTSFLSFFWDNLSDIMESREFLELSKVQLSALLSTRVFDLLSSDLVVNSFLTWIDYDRSNRQQYLPHLLSFIDLSNVSKFIISDMKDKQYLSDPSILEKSNVANVHESSENNDIAESAALLAEPSILFFGDSLERSLTCQFYYLNRQCWSDVNCVQIPIRRAMATTFTGKHVYFIGGLSRRRQATNEVMKYDVYANHVERVIAMKTERAHAKAAYLNGTLYAVGGKSTDDDLLTTVEAYHEGTDEWTLLSPLIKAVRRGTVVKIDGCLYVVGICHGAEVQRYDPNVDQWSVVIEMFPDLSAVRLTACAWMCELHILATDFFDNKKWIVVKNLCNDGQVRHNGQVDPNEQINPIEQQSWTVSYVSDGPSVIIKIWSYQSDGGLLFYVLDEEANLHNFDPVAEEWNSLPEASEDKRIEDIYYAVMLT